MSHVLRLLLFLDAFFLLFAASLCGQAITGDLLVNVTDPSGAVVGGARLELVETGTNLKFPAETDSLGNHLYSQLKPGLYKLTVTAPGFQVTVLDDIRILIGQRTRVDVRLIVGAVTETVTVSAGTVTLLNSESAAMGQVIDQKPIVELPLNGRNFIQLAQISAGAVPIGIGVSPATSWTGRGDSTLSIAGGRETNVSFLVNGIETRNSRFGSAGIRPSIEAIQEFRVQRTTFGAEFGRSAAIVNTTLRSGTNELHLTAFEFLRNRNLDANNFFANRTGQRKPPFSQNNFGTAVGGPVRLPKIYDGRDKTFFFFNFEGLRQREGITSTGIYPSRAQLSGNLADDSAGTGFYPLVSAFCQANRGSRKCMNVIDPTSGQPFAGNVIPTGRLDPITQKALPWILTPNLAEAAGAAAFPNFNTVGAPKIINDWDQYNVRLDHRLGSKDHLFGSFSYADEAHLRPALRPLGGDNFPQSNRLVTATYNRIFSPSILNEFRFGYNRSRTFRLAETSFGRDYAREVFGLKNTTDQPIMFGVPGFNITGFSGVGSISQAIGALDENFQFVDNLSITSGKHNLRTGFQISRQKYFQITNFSGNPSFNFDGRYTGIQGFGLADFLLGIPFRASGAIGDSIQNLRTTFWSGYLQNDWRVLPSLTLNFGLRYEYAPSPTEKDNKSLVFSPELARTVLAGQGVRRSIVDPDWNNFAPRVGFAYRPRFLKNTVLRGGAGIYYSTDNFNEEQFKAIGPPLFQPQTIDGDPRRPTLFMRDMLPSFAASPNINPFSFDRLNRTPYLSQWSFGIQRTLGNDFLAEVEYAGSTGQKLPQRRNLNIARLDPTGAIPIAQRAPYPQFSFILLTYNGGWSSYNALTAKLEKRFTGGLYLLASYTLQKSLDLGATDEFSALSGEFKKWDKGHSTFDVPQRLVLSYVYELPFGRGKPLWSNVRGVADKLLSGWQINGITTFAEGQFRTVTLGLDWLVIGTFTQSRPNIVGDIKAGRSLPDAYLSPAAFDFPRDAAGNRIRVQGNAGRNSIQMPGLNNWDLGIFKNTSVGERFVTQFRLEMFNGFNHTQFGPPNLSSTSPNFGRIGGTLVTARRIQMGLKINY